MRIKGILIYLLIMFSVTNCNFLNEYWEPSDVIGSYLKNIDRDPPVLTISSPTNGQEVGSVYPLSLNLYDVGSEENTLYLSIDHQEWIPHSVSGYFTTNIELTLFGWHTNSLFAVDAEGNISVTNHIYVQRSSVPSLIINNPCDYILTNTANVVFDGLVSIDPPYEVLSLRYSTNQTNYYDIHFNGTNWFLTLSNLSDGIRNIYFRAIGNNGKQTEIHRTIIIDTLPPQLEILSPYSLQEVGEIYTFNGLANDEVTNVEWVKIQQDTNQWKELPLSLGVSWSTNLSLTGYGHHTNWVSAMDSAGNTNTLMVIVKRTSIPGITITSIANGAQTNRNHLLLSGEATVDPPFIIEKIELSTNNSGYFELDNTNWSIHLTNLSEGINTLQARAIASSGKTNTSSEIAFSVDTIPPAINILSHTNHQEVENQYELFGTTSDNGSGIAHIYIRLIPDALSGTAPLDWVELNISAGYWSRSFLVGHGRHSNQIMAVDKTGNISTNTLFLEYPDYPNLSITSPRYNSITNTHYLNISGTSEIESPYSIDGIIVVVNSSTNYTATGTSNWSAQIALLEGENYCSVTVYSDTDKSVKSSNWIINVDTEPPTNFISFPSNNQEVGATYTLAGNVSDSISGVKQVFVRKGTDPYREVPVTLGGWSTNFSVSANGYYNNEVFAVDMMNNSTITQSITVSKVNIPTILITNMGYSLTTNDPTPVIAGIAEIEGETITNILISVSGSEYFSITNVIASNIQWYYELTNLIEGGNTITLQAISTNGKTAFSTTVSIRLDTTQPILDCGTNRIEASRNFELIKEARDNYSDTITIYYSTNNGGSYIQKSYTNQGDGNVELPNGIYYIKAFAIDGSFNHSITNDVLISIDTICVNGSISLNGTGLPDSPYKDVQNAIESDFKYIRMQSGYYNGYNGLSLLSYALSISKDNIHLSGGWSDSFTNKSGSTIFSPSLGNKHALNIKGCKNITIRDIIIRNFLADGSLAHQSGAGIEIFNVTNLTIENIHFSNNISINKGGGLYIQTSTNVRIISSVFYSNITTNYGGAVSGYDSSIYISNSQFINNVSKESAGALSIEMGSLISKNSGFFQNNALKGMGGAIYLNRTMEFGCEMVSNIIMSNEANYYGGAVYMNETKINMSYNSFSINSSFSTVDDGIYCDSKSHFEFFNNQITYHPSWGATFVTTDSTILESMNTFLGNGNNGIRTIP